MDAFSDPDVEEVVLMASAQIGKTESFVNNTIGYFIHQQPCPILMVQPSLAMAQTWSKDRFAPMIRDSKVLKGLIKDPRAKNSENTILAKSFDGGRLSVIGANSPASLASRPIRVVLLDEPDRYPPSAGTEGDPSNLARARTKTYWNRKVGICGTPTVKGSSRIEMAYLESDQRTYEVPCPHCDHYQVLKWRNVKWDKDRPDTARMICEECEKEIHERDRDRMILRGNWVAGEKFNGIAGFHINELYSPWVRWSDMVARFLEAKKFPETLKVWINTSLGESFEESGDSVDQNSLLARREHYPQDTLPEGVLVVTMAVDVQIDRLELEFRGWGLNEETWGLEYLVLAGNPSGQELWESLDQQMSKTFKTVTGGTLKVACVTVDSGGQHTQEVYQFCRTKQPGRVYPIKGSSVRGVPALHRMSQDRKTGVRFFVIGTDSVKDTLFGRMEIAEPGAGYCHFPVDYLPDYFDQLTAEHCVTRFKKGIPYREWVMRKNRKRNEALDIFVYNYVALRILNPNFEAIKNNMEAKQEGEVVTQTKQPARQQIRRSNFVKKRGNKWF